jgi:hypothetical protein
MPRSEPALYFGKTVPNAISCAICFNGLTACGNTPSHEWDERPWRQLRILKTWRQGRIAMLPPVDLFSQADAERFESIRSCPILASATYNRCMSDVTDHDLIREYAQSRSEEAFGEIEWES